VSSNKWGRQTRFGHRAQIAVAILVIALCGACHTRHADSSSGPLIANDPTSAYSASFRTNVDEPYTFSDVILRNVGDSVITITGISLVQPQGLEVVGTSIGVTPGAKYPSGARGFPPPYRFPMVPALGAQIPPTPNGAVRHTLLIVGLRPTTPGITSITGIEVHYGVPGGEESVLLVKYAVTFCSPRSYYEHHKLKCTAPTPAASLPGSDTG